MPQETLKEGEKTEEQLEEEIKALQDKEDVNDEEKENLEKLKSERNSRAQKKINELHGRLKSAEEEKGKFSQEAEAMRSELSSMKEELQRLKARPVDNKTVDVGDKQYYTDEALRTMIESNQMTEAEAYKHQQQRIKAEVKQELKEEMGVSEKQREEFAVRKSDSEKVLAKYPHFDKNSPNFNPNDPLYLKAVDIYSSGLNTNPRGLSKAVELAEEALGMKGKNPDVSDDLSVHSNRTAASGNRDNEKEVELSDDEMEMAIRMYHMAGVMNPKTKRVYTKDEAVAKFKEAKTKNKVSRRVT